MSYHPPSSSGNTPPPPGDASAPPPPATAWSGGGPPVGLRPGSDDGDNQRCYRHTGRTTGRNCTRCGRPACSECLQSAAVGSLCPECVKSGPKVPTQQKVLARTDGTPATYGLIAICIVLFVVSVSQDSRALMSEVVTPLHVELDLVKAALAEGEFWRLVTSGFMHFGALHLGFNMFLLLQLGRLIEPATGSIKFLLLYFASLLAGSFGVVLSASELTISAGASGAVFGLMGAAAVGQWLRGVNPFSSSLGLLIGLNLAFTFMVPNIAIGAHLGGLVGGSIVGFFVLPARKDTYRPIVQYGVPAGVIIIATIASIYLTDPGVFGLA